MLYRDAQAGQIPRSTVRIAVDMADRIALQPLAGQRIYFEAEVVRWTPARDNVRRLKGIPHLCLKPVDINGRSLPQAPGSRDPMHLWVAFPSDLIELSDSCTRVLRIRGFGIVVLYRRENGSLAYGLSHAADLEVQCGAEETWSTWGQAAVRQRPVLPDAHRALPLEAAHTEYQAWLSFVHPKVALAHRKVVGYRQRKDDLHDGAYCEVLEKAWSTVNAGLLPEATALNTAYYLLGQWRAGQAPRHLRETYP